jgi:hypothetical protein
MIKTLTTTTRMPMWMRLKYKIKGHHQGCCFQHGSLQTNVSQNKCIWKKQEKTLKNLTSSRKLCEAFMGWKEAQCSFEVDKQQLKTPNRFTDAFQDEFSLRSIVSQVSHLEATPDHLKSKCAIEASQTGYHRLILKEPKLPPHYACKGV